MATKENASVQSAQLPMNDRQKKKEALAKQYNYLRDKAREKVKGKFIYHEVPGGVMSFSYGPVYKGDHTERYDLLDQGIYELPLGVAVHLNKNVWYPEYGFIPGEAVQGGYSPASGMRITQKVRRCSFQSLEFVDVEDLPSDIVAVERIL